MTLRCSQCPTEAFYIVGDQQGDKGTPLCLECYSKLEDIRFRHFLMAAAGANQAADDMDEIVGLGRSGGRFPVEALAKAASMARTYNSIRIANSNIGVINTGNLARIDAAVTITQGTEIADFGARLKDLVETIVADQTLASEKKKELVEVATAISDQVVSKTPSKRVIQTLFSELVSLSSGFSTIKPSLGAKDWVESKNQIARRAQTGDNGEPLLLTKTALHHLTPSLPHTR